MRHGHSSCAMLSDEWPGFESKRVHCCGAGVEASCCDSAQSMDLTSGCCALQDPNTGVVMFESSAIVEYLYKAYGPAAA